MGNRLAIGVDLGGTNIRIALGDKEGHILIRLLEQTEKKKGPEGVSNQIIEAIHRLKKGKTSKDEIKGIGIGSTGPIDLKRGRLVKPTNIPYKSVPIVEPLQDEFGLPTYLLNDCSLSVMGEKYFGAGKCHNNLVYVTLSTGIGGGVYVDGHLIAGKDGNAAEIGHLTIDYNGQLLCGCGKRGHWEAYCSGKGIPNFISLLLKEKKSEHIKNSLLREFAEDDLSKITVKTLYDAANVGDQLSREIAEKIGILNAIGFACLTDSYDPSLTTVGGAIALKNTSMVIEPIRRHISEHARNQVPKIMITPLGKDVGLIGAIAKVFHPYE